MQQIGRGTAIIVVVSDKSLRSPYCMYELLEIHRNLNFADRIFPIVQDDAKIQQLEDRWEYVAHWKTKQKKLEELLQTIGTGVVSSSGGFSEYKRIQEIAHRADELLSILGRMNTLQPASLEANNFELLKNSIIDWFQKLRSEG